MKKRKILVRLLAMVLLLSVFATGCAQTPEPIPAPDAVTVDNGNNGDNEGDGGLTESENGGAGTITDQGDGTVSPEDGGEETLPEEGEKVPEPGESTPTQKEEITLPEYNAPAFFEKFEIASDEVTELSYEVVFCDGMQSTTYKINFIENKVYCRIYDPYFERYPGNLSESILESEKYKNNGLWLEIKNFTEAEEELFFKICEENSFFDIEKEYYNHSADGSCWELNVKYGNGDIMHSEGFNDEPTEIFRACSAAFYDLCGADVLGFLPEWYVTPPNVEFHFEFHYSEMNYVGAFAGGAIRADCYWNDGRTEVKNADIFELNQKYNFKRLCNSVEAFGVTEVLSYKLDFFTDVYVNPAPYRGEKFTKFILKSYDYNEELTGETLIAEKEWFSNFLIELELNKIYVYELQFEDGDFVRYTFNTKL